MVIIVPCAGLSSRFPNSLPKYVLSCYNGDMVLENVLKDYIWKHEIYVSILKEHEEKFNIKRRLKYKFGNRINIVEIDKLTKGSADTVYQTLKLANISDDTPFLVRDCDSFFNHIPNETGNFVYCSHINHGKNLPAKSYIEFNDQNILTNIIEKKIVSEYFCVGGYQFDSVKLYKQYFDTISQQNGELYISEIIGNMINNNEVFVKSIVDNYNDLGTLKEFKEYNNRPTYFSDIDGVICKVQSRYDENPFCGYIPIQENVDALLEKYNNGCQIIFTTARDSIYETETREMLDEMGFVDCLLLMDIHRSKRIVINDYQEEYNTCQSICIKSEEPELYKFL